MSRSSIYLNLLWSHTSDKTPPIPLCPASDCIVLVRQARMFCPAPPPPHPHPCPAGPWADGTVSGADVDNQGSQSVSWPVHSSTVPHRGFGPEWDSPDNHPSLLHPAVLPTMLLGWRCSLVLGFPGAMECGGVQGRCQSHSLQASILLLCANTPSDVQSLKAVFLFSIRTFSLCFDSLSIIGSNFHLM